jgi:DNA-binding transcriptional MerR regulator/quercetin dioxygenase-like cupin family protein
MPAGNEQVAGNAPLAHAVTIGEAATLVGVSRAMLRVWERERLISPRRTAGGHRLYSADDLARLRQIVRLRSVERLNAAAIRRELGPAEPAPPTDGGAVNGDLGRRLRALRTANGWSLATVAARSGLSISFLSSVERGQSSISVGNLFKLADAYGTTVPGLGADRRPDHRSLLHPAERRRYIADAGRVLIEDLIADAGALEAQRIEIHPGGGSGEAYTHPGEEFIYVLTGCLTFLIDETEHYRLTEGDSLYFLSQRRHRWWNDGEVTATVLWINVPVVQPAADQAGPRTRAAGRRRDGPAIEPSESKLPRSSARR